MKLKPFKTYSQKPAETTGKWHLIDAAGLPLGRLATEAAKLLIGKHKPTYTPHVNGGDWVVVINSDQVAVTG
ncbi:50S ribosomal protein L13, partial [Candidatus Saccharibacteria bacterium]|nr:50S ribosomal protein L13 [Candidatus Saccharibacteria bacterium]